MEYQALSVCLCINGSSSSHISQMWVWGKCFYCQAALKYIILTWKWSDIQCLKLFQHWNICCNTEATVVQGWGELLNNILPVRELKQSEIEKVVGDSNLWQLLWSDYTFSRKMLVTPWIQKIICRFLLIVLTLCQIAVWKLKIKCIFISYHGFKGKKISDTNRIN